MSRIEEKIDNNLRKGPAGFGMLVAMFVLVFLVGAGAGIFGGIFWGKKIANKNNAKSETANSGEVKGETNTNKSKTPVTDGSSVQEYTVKAGETLFTIGLKFNLPWTKIAEYNGLSEDSVIKQGQVLKIPADGTTGAASSESKTFDINTSQSNQIQSQVDAGSLAWYLDPILVAKDQVPPTFSINKDDQFSLKSKSFTEGIAIVEVIHGTKIYQIKLIQPVKKGENGIWVCESVSAA